MAEDFDDRRLIRRRAERLETRARNRHLILWELRLFVALRRESLRRQLSRKLANIKYIVTALEMRNA